MTFDFHRAFDPDMGWERGAGQTCAMIAEAVYRIDLFEPIDILVYAAHENTVEDMRRALDALRVTYTTRRIADPRVYDFQCLTDCGATVRLRIKVRRNLNSQVARDLRGCRAAVFIDHYLWDSGNVTRAFQDVLLSSPHIEFFSD